jgi:SWI/SNF-related matrix-associated actin-dependent regulator 1 of chromatin subfamily A
MKYDSLHGTEKQKMNTEIKNNIHTLNRIVSTSKVNQVKLLINSLVEEGQKVVVFSGYKDPINKLEEIYKDKCVKIDGSVQPHKRQQLINKFIENDKCMVFLGNMKAAGIGINLVNANHVIMMNFPFTPEQIEQAQKRLHRSGQKNTVNVYYTIAKGTIDEHIFDLVAEKAEDINELIDGDSKHTINYNDLPGKLFKKLLG